MAHHPIVHIDFEGADPKALAGFYGDLFGWQIHTDVPSNYTMFQAEGGPGGGFVPLSGSGNQVIVYVHTDDIEASLARAVELGGAVCVPKQEMPGGAWAVFTDPTGNKVGLLYKAES